MTVNSDKRHVDISAGVVALVATLAASYVVSQLLRNSIGVIAPDLAAEMAISASELGVLSSAFFFSFAAAQLPLGVAIDRYGPKTCMIVCAGVVVAASVLFAVAATPTSLVVARILMGLGTSCLSDGAADALCPPFPARAVRHAGRASTRSRQHRNAACDGAAGLRGGDDRLARGLRR